MRTSSPTTSSEPSSRETEMMRILRVPSGIVACALAALVWCVSVDTARAVQQKPAAPAAPAASSQVALPNKPDTLHFAVIGDNGTGEQPEYEVGEQLLTW